MTTKAGYFLVTWPSMESTSLGSARRKGIPHWFAVFSVSVLIAKSNVNNFLAVFQCVCLVDALGNRTMRPCLSNAVKVQVHTWLYCLKHPLWMLPSLRHAYRCHFDFVMFVCLTYIIFSFFGRQKNWLNRILRAPRYIPLDQLKYGVFFCAYYPVTDLIY